MLPVISGLFVLPLLISGLVLILPKNLSRILVITTGLILTAASLFLFFSVDKPYRFRVPEYTNQIVAGADILLLVFFAWIAIKRKSALVGLMTALQLGASV